jgi:UDP-glucuronate decarboxylase
MKTEARRVLVTGGAGFLGSHMCERLLEEGHEVICLDNFHTGRRQNVFQLLGQPTFSVIEHDVTNPIYLQVDQIINMACPASPIHYQLDPVHTTKTSVLGILNMLGLAKRVGATLLQASTSEVYGDPEVHPERESYWGHVNPTGTRACYDEGKRCAETLCFDYYRRHQIPVKVVRIFNTYGPRMHPNDGRVVSNFVVQALRNEPITIFGDGSQTRSFCFVDDLVDGIMRMMAGPPEMTGPLNLGNPRELTIAELAELVVKLTGSRSKLIRKPLPSDDPKRRCPDISLAQQTLGWTPKVTLRDGLIRVIEYFEEFLGEAGRRPDRKVITPEAFAVQSRTV